MFRLFNADLPINEITLPDRSNETWMGLTRRREFGYDLELTDGVQPMSSGINASFQFITK